MMYLEMIPLSLRETVAKQIAAIWRLSKTSMVADNVMLAPVRGQGLTKQHRCRWSRRTTALPYATDQASDSSPMALCALIGRVDPKAFHQRSRETVLPRTVTFPAAVVVTLWCVLCALMADAWATPLERVEFESASQRLNSIEVIPGDRIQGYLAKPEGAGPFPAVIGLHGCAGMHDTTKQRLTDDLVEWGYVILLVDSYATRGIEHACTSSAFATVIKRTRDAYGALVFLARQTSHLQPGRTVWGHWLEYNGEAGDNATHRLHQFLDRHLN